MAGNSGKSLEEATRGRASFSGHGASKGAAGFISPYDESQVASFLSKPGETAIINPPEDGMESFQIGVEWDNVAVEKEKNVFAKFFKKNVQKAGIDLDLGVLYELENGKRGGIQAFGESYGHLEQEPYIKLSGDERTGEKEGHDEVIIVNGAYWDKIKRILIYIYIYDGASNWASVRPQVQVRVPGEDPMVVTLGAKRQEMVICAVASIENIRGGIRMTNHMEYYPSHPAMDRAFGFGLQWDEGSKS